MAENFKDELVSQKYHWAKEEELFLLKPYLDAIGSTEGKAILDVGCGSGWITKIVAENAKKVVGIDNSKNLIDIAKSENSSENIQYELLDAEDMGSINEEFDTVISALTLQLVTPKEKLLTVLKKCNSKLNDDGKLIALVPHPCFVNQNAREYNKYTFEKEFNYFVDPQEYSVELKSQKGPLKFKANFYNLETYSTLFNKAGFVIEKIIEPRVTEDLINEFPDLWDLELKKPFYIIFKLAK